jgi:hypothetical protein
MPEPDPFITNRRARWRVTLAGSTFSMVFQ